MKTVWKWILGIVIVLVVVGLVVGAVFAWQHGAFTMRRAPFAYRQFQGQTAPGKTAPQNNQTNPSTPTTPTAPQSNRRGFMPGRGQGFGYGPMMMGSRGFNRFGMMMPFGPFGMGLMFFGAFLRLIIPLGILALVAWLFYSLGKRAGKSSAAVQATNPAPAPTTDTPTQN
jgi:hypothetical protein